MNQQTKPVKFWLYIDIFLIEKGFLWGSRTWGYIQKAKHVNYLQACIDKEIKGEKFVAFTHSQTATFHTAYRFI